MDIEVWKPIKGYEGLYEISSIGNIRSSKFNRVKTSSPDKDGYLVISLWKNNKQRRFRMHRLVAQAFIPNPNNYPQINHINEIKDDNRIENLEWCTQKYNNMHGSRLKNLRRRVAQYSLNGELIKIWDSITSAGNYFGVNTPIIYTCQGKRNKAYGYIWRYVDNE